MILKIGLSGYIQISVSLHLTEMTVFLCSFKVLFRLILFKQCTGLRDALTGVWDYKAVCAHCMVAMHI